MRITPALRQMVSIHGSGRAAYELLVASDYFIQASNQLLSYGNPTYTREKLQAGLGRVTSALYEGVRASDDPALLTQKRLLP